MKKEKTIRAYKRKTKSGKVVNVRQHTAKYDAAEEFKKAMQKRGAGDELERKLTAKELKEVESIVSENSELDPEYLAAFYPDLSPRMVKEVMHAYQKKSAVPTPAARAKAEKLPKSAPSAKSSTDISAEDYKAWYNWDMVDDPKNEAALRVKKALTKKLGAKGYAAYEKEMSDSWSARGHAKAFRSLGTMDKAVADTNAGDAKAAKRPSSTSGSMESPKSVTASFTRGTRKEKVSLIGSPVKDTDSGSGYLALGKLKDGRVEPLMSDDGKTWKHAEGWGDSPSIAGTALSKLIRKNGYTTKWNKEGYLEIKSPGSNELLDSLGPREFTTRGGRGKHLTKKALAERPIKTEKGTFRWTEDTGAGKITYDSKFVTKGGKTMMMVRESGTTDSWTPAEHTGYSSMKDFPKTVRSEAAAKGLTFRGGEWVQVGSKASAPTKQKSTTKVKKSR